ncbi:hypothetical protein BCR33DRAFT_762547, partial [Rhizoclosmatium globosum]
MSLQIHFDGSCCAKVSAQDDLTIHLSPSGAQLVVLHSANNNAELLRVHTANVPLKLKANVAELLRFRNRYSSAPVFCANILENGYIKARKVKESAFARWEVPSDGGKPGEIRQQIQTVDGHVSVSISPNKQSVIVCYPARVVTDDGREESKLFCEVKQEFSVLDIPECWNYPVELLSGVLNKQELMNLASQIPGSISSVRYIAIPLPKTNQDISRSSSVNANFNPSKTWTCTWPIKVLQTETALYRVILHRGIVIVEATFLEDGAALRTDRDFKFLSLYLNDESGHSEMYEITNAPNVVRNWKTGVQYLLKEVVLEMTRLYQLSLRSTVDLQSVQNMAYIVGHQDHVLGEELAAVKVEGVGLFKAFSDYSVVVQFDSAITIKIYDCDKICGHGHLSGLEKMELGLDNVIAHIIDSNHEEYNIRVYCPIGVEKEMSQVLQFVDWAFNERRSEKNEPSWQIAEEMYQSVVERGR